MTAAVWRAGTRLVTTDRTGPDAGTSLADARTAHALARGVAVADIDPATGHDLSRPAYERVRAGWQQAAADGELCPHMRRGYEATRARWAAARPDWVAADGDWLTGGAR